MNRIPILKLTPLNIHSASSCQILKNLTNFNSLLPSVCLKPLNLHSASSVRVPSISINNCFHNGPKVVLSPLSKSIQKFNSVNIRLLKNNFKRRVYPKNSMCNTKRCGCCSHLSCKSTIKSNVNGRVFSVNLVSDVD